MNHSMQRNRWTLLSAMVAATVTAPTIAGDTIYSQPPLFGNGNSFPADIAGGQQADEWTAMSAVAITTVRWWGTDGSNTGPGDFTIRFFANNSGLPGSLLNQFTVGSAYSQLGTGMSDMNGRDIYEFQADLTGGFTPSLGSTYWLSIVNNQAVSGPPMWLWHQGSNGNGSHAFRIGAGPWDNIGGDMAFELIAIPSPGVLGLLGAAALLGIRRRRA